MSHNFIATVTICSDFGAQENEIFHYFCFSPLSAMKLCLILVPGKFLFFGFFSSFTTSRLSYVCVHVELLQSCLTLRNPMDSSPSGSFVQARMLEWVSMPSSGGMEVIFMTQESNQHLPWFLPGTILYH